MPNHINTEEITLKSTPPLKRISTPPSVKLLFPLNQCKSLFPKFTANSIKTYTSQYNKSIIHNLSDPILTEDELSVLTKGLSFVATPTKTFKEDTNKSWNKLKTQMLTQYFFRNNIHDKIPPFKKKSSWTPPLSLSDNSTLTNFFTRTEQNVISVTTPGRKTYSSLTLQEKTAFNNLKTNQSIIIKPCDKGGGICIMNTRDYLTKIHLHLQDRDTYNPLTYSPTSVIVNDTCTLIEYIHSQHIIDNATKEFLLPPKNTCTPLFYGLPKLHKPGYPLHPIVSGCDGPTDHLSTGDTHFIQHIASNLPSHVEDPKHFLNLIEKLPHLPPKPFFVTADVTLLYTNIPHQEDIAAVINFMEEYKRLLPTNCVHHLK